MRYTFTHIYICIKAALKLRQPYLCFLIFALVYYTPIGVLFATDLGVTTVVYKPTVDSLINLEKPDLKLMEQAILRSINNYRIKNKLPELIWSDTLYKSSEYHLKNMITKKFFDHDDPKDSKYPNLQKRVKKFFGNYQSLGENLIQHFPYKFKAKSIEYNITKIKGKFYYSDPSTGKPLQVLTYKQFADQIVYNWSISPPHKENMMNYNFRRLGVAIYFPKYNLTPDIVPITVVTNYGSLY